MKLLQIVRAAIPDATPEYAEHILWGRTPFPMTKISAKEIYKAASRMQRAYLHHLRLCEFCNRIARQDQWTCERCQAALDRCRENL